MHEMAKELMKRLVTHAPCAMQSCITDCVYASQSQFGQRHIGTCTIALLGTKPPSDFLSEQQEQIRVTVSFLRLNVLNHIALDKFTQNDGLHLPHKCNQCFPNVANFLRIRLLISLL